MGSIYIGHAPLYWTVRTHDGSGRGPGPETRTPDPERAVTRGSDMAAVEGEACEARTEAAMGEAESLAEEGSEGVSVEQDFCARTWHVEKLNYERKIRAYIELWHDVR